MGKAKPIDSASLRNLYRKGFGRVYSTSLEAIFKAFTTDPYSTGSVHYHDPIPTHVVDSLLLNPFGRNSVGEYVTYGDNVSSSMLSDGDALDANYRKVRSMGFKTPMTYIGWGYDIFGYPSPNYHQPWDASGVYSPHVSDFHSRGKFFAAYDDEFDLEFGEDFGVDSDKDKWKAGPLDLRWDQIRGVWTMHYGVYPAIVRAAYNAGSPITNFSEPVWGHTLTYDAYVYDGISSGIIVTGVGSEIPRPDPGTYKVYPVNTGSSCFIGHRPDNNGRPSFGLMIWEKPFVTGCSATGVGATEEILEYLQTNPLGTQYGGTGFDALESGFILIGDSNDTPKKRFLTGMSGCQVQEQSTNLKIGLEYDYQLRRDRSTPDTNGSVLQFYENTWSNDTNTRKIHNNIYASGPISSGYYLNLIDTSSGQINVSLLDATQNTGREFIFKDIGGSGAINPVWIIPVLNQRIDGGTSGKIHRNYGFVKIFSNGSNWYTLGADALPTGVTENSATWVDGGAGIFEA